MNNNPKINSKLRPLVIAAICILVCSPALGLDLPPPPPPPSPYVLKGSCPFECCTYRTWSVEAETTLYAQPDLESKQIGVLKAHETVEGVTGEVHSIPVRFIVHRAYQDYKPGDIVWVYSYEGEGYFQILRNGKLVSEELGFSPYGGSSGNRCQDDEQYCWGTLEKEMSNTWWVKIKSKNGLEGWSNRANNFGNTDACS